MVSCIPTCSSFSFCSVMFAFSLVLKREGFQFVFPSVLEGNEGIQAISTSTIPAVATLMHMLTSFKIILCYFRRRLHSIAVPEIHLTICD